MQKSIEITTLADLKAHSYLVTAHGPDCRRLSIVDLDGLGQALGLGFDYVTGKLGKRLKCSVCGCNGVGLSITPPTRLIPNS